MALEMVEPCPHDISEQDVAAQADGLCPLCLAADIVKLRQRVTALETIIAEDLPAEDCSDEFSRMLVEQIHARAAQ